MDSSERDLERLKVILREKDIPFFSDEELVTMLGNGEDFQTVAYRCLIIKSEETSISVSGLTLGDSSAYFKRLARMYKPNNSGVL